jgi:hypothetical protein
MLQGGRQFAGTESFIGFCNFCHNRNIGNYWIEVKATKMA